MKRLTFLLLLGLWACLLLACASSDPAPEEDGDLTDGDTTDGDEPDGDLADGDIADGDIADGDIADGDTPDGDTEDGDIHDGDIEDGDTDEEEPLPDPTYWSAEATVVVDDLNFVMVDGEPFFAIGFDTHSGDMYDGETGPGECDRENGIGYVNYQVEKTKLPPKPVRTSPTSGATALCEMNWSTSIRPSRENGTGVTATSPRRKTM